MTQTTSLPPSPDIEGGDMTLWPNPTTGMIYWKGIPENQAVTVQVFDALGRLRLDQQVAGTRSIWEPWKMACISSYCWMEMAGNGLLNRWF
ncbi:MAG: T9SS type A sorting domain-containing protein [Lewinellaceae bacterium]|nr:T9SS type A sorting domain-containing protein [Lewinellaceae bacterium]